MSAGTVFGVGVGPGDPELLTIKAANVLARARVVAYFSKRNKLSNALSAAERYLNREAEQLALVYPYTTEISAGDARYVEALAAFYESSAATLAGRLERGLDVAILCEGDPLFYGSYLHLHARLSARYGCVVVPGITSFAGCAARAGVPLATNNQVFSSIPGTLPEAELERRLAAADAVAIIKLGSNFAKVRRVLERLGRARGATYVEHGTTPQERIMPLEQKRDDHAVYFSLILVPPARTPPEPNA